MSNASLFRAWINAGTARSSFNRPSARAASVRRSKSGLFCKTCINGFTPRGSRNSPSPLIAILRTCASLSFSEALINASTTLSYRPSSGAGLHIELTLALFRRSINALAAIRRTLRCESDLNARINAFVAFGSLILLSPSIARCRTFQLLAFSSVKSSASKPRVLPSPSSALSVNSHTSGSSSFFKTSTSVLSIRELLCVVSASAANLRTSRTSSLLRAVVSASRIFASNWLLSCLLSLQSASAAIRRTTLSLSYLKA